MSTIEPDRLAAVTGGIWYGETKSPTGERWAANVDAGYSKAMSYLPEPHRTGAMLMTLPTLGVAEWGARRAGAAWDYFQRSKP